MAGTMSTDSMTLNSMSGHDQMDPEVRAQIQSNIHVIYEPSIAPCVHIATCRSVDGSFMAFLVMHGNILKTVWNPNLLAGDARQTRSAAMMSLLEATEDRIREMLIKTDSKAAAKTEKDNKQRSSVLRTRKDKKSDATTIDSTSVSEQGSVDYNFKPKEREKSFVPWRKNGGGVKSENVYTRSD